MKLTVKATRADKWWAIEVPEIEGLFIQTRHLGQVEAMVKDAAAGLTERPEQDFEVAVLVTNQNMQKAVAFTSWTRQQAQHERPVQTNSDGADEDHVIRMFDKFESIRTARPTNVARHRPVKRHNRISR